MFPKKSALAAALVALVSLLFVGTAEADFPGQQDDTITSLGSFQIFVVPAFQPLMAGYPMYDPGTKILTSPLLFDPATVIGVSAPHTDRSAADKGGTKVGLLADVNGDTTADTPNIIKDGDFRMVPFGFQGPPGTREVHTEIRALDLAAGAVHVRAGTKAPDQPLSPGEVESQDDDGPASQDFPADSFFNVFVEVDLPAIALFPGATLYNPGPLLVVHEDLTMFPPKVVYRHGNTTAVLLRVKGTDAIFGYLVLAGHGADFDLGDIAEFESIVSGFTPMQLGIGGIAELPDVDVAPLEAGDSSGLNTGAVAGIAGAVAAIAVTLGGAAWYARRRWLN